MPPNGCKKVKQEILNSSQIFCLILILDLNKLFNLEESHSKVS